MEEKSFTVQFLGKNYVSHYIKKNETASWYLEELMKKDVLFGLDTETKSKKGFETTSNPGLSFSRGEVRLLQIFDGHQIYLFDFLFLDKSLFKEFLESKDFIAHNAKFDIAMLKNCGIEKINCGCTLIAFRLLVHEKFWSDSVITSASLAAVVKYLFGEDILKVLQTSDWYKENLTYEQLEYAALDPLCVRKIADRLTPMLKKKKLLKIYRLYKEAQHPIVEMESVGISIDHMAHKELMAIYRKSLNDSRLKILQATGLDGITGPKLAAWLDKNLTEEEKKKWPRTSKGQLSTASDTFQQLSDLPIVGPFLEYQKAEKLLTTYGNKLLYHVEAKTTKRLHPNYNISGARTGRLSCTRPNLQNQPRDKMFRKLYVPREGYLIVCADYSQIEVRVCAEVSGDELMKRVYRGGLDIYRETASRVLNKRVDDVSPTERQQMKAVVLGRLFGLGAKKFVTYAKVNYQLEVTLKEAEAFIEGFKEAYPQFTQWQYAQAKRCENLLKAYTVYGKARALDKDNFYGSGLNHPIQGTAAEIILCGLCNIFKRKEKSSFLIGCVHDEISLEVPEDRAEAMRDLLIECMVDGFLEVFPSGITTKLVEAKIGKSWGEAK